VLLTAEAIALTIFLMVSASLSPALPDFGCAGRVHLSDWDVGGGRDGHSKHFDERSQSV